MKANEDHSEEYCLLLVRINTINISVQEELGTKTRCVLDYDFSTNQIEGQGMCIDCMQ